jgi:hypothetical protein
VTVLEPLWRGGADTTQQVDLHLLPIVVHGGDEAGVLVATGRATWSAPRRVALVASFLGVQPGDEVEMAVDVVADDQRVLYARSIHKECRGIYDAWHYQPTFSAEVEGGVTATVTCRVNGPNREGAMSALFEGLVRIWVE